MQDKVYILLAGVNGAGKSTFYSLPKGNGPLFPFCDNKRFSHLPLINSDNIVRSIGSWQDSGDQFEAGRLALKAIRDCFKRGASFCQETTLSGMGIIRNINTAKELGYKVGIVYVGVESVDIAKQRVRHRVESGGHGIPDSDIERRYLSSFNNLNKVMSICDRVLLCDNSSPNGFRTVAEYDGKQLKMLGGYSPVPRWVQKHIDFPVVNEPIKKKGKGFPRDDYPGPID